MSIKNVIIIGAGGNLGPSILNAFLNESSFNTTVLSREGSKSTFPSGAKVIRANYDSLDSLKSAFQGQDVALSLIGGNGVGDQNKLIDAAIAAGVQRFLPSEYGSNTPDERARKIVPMWNAKVSAVNYLKSKESEISWTSIVTGNFFDWGLRVGFMGFDGATKTARIFDGGEAVFATTTLHQVGVAAVKALEHADLTKNRYVHIGGFLTSQNEILAAAEKVTGVKWTVEKTTTKEEIEVGRKKIQEGDWTGLKELIQSVNFGKEEQLGDFSSQGLWNEKLGVPKEDLEETVRAVFA